VIAADLTPGQRLIRARWNLRNLAESWLTEPEPPAGSDEARSLYEGLTFAAREMVAAQDAFDSRPALPRAVAGPPIDLGDDPDGDNTP
jgi:hypothetical protein